MEKGWGLNPYKDMKKINLDENTQTILTLFNQSATDPTSVNEVIEDFTNRLLERNGVQKIAQYFLDHSMHFKRIIFTDLKKMLAQLEAETKSKDAKKEGERKLF